MDNYGNLVSLLSEEEKLTEVFKKILNKNLKDIVKETGLSESELKGFIENIMIV